MYCCDACHAAAVAERRRLRHEEKVKARESMTYICKTCQKEFKPNTGKQKYCCAECRKKAIAESRKSVCIMAADEVEPKKEKVTAKSPASRRWEKMNLQERAIECNRHHISYGQAQVAAMNGTLPMDWGLCR